jgi:hypothetical protein
LKMNTLLTLKTNNMKTINNFLKRFAHSTLLAGAVYLSASTSFAQLTNNHTWVHPGAMNSKDELDFVKAKIAAKANPWYTVFNTMVRDFATAYNKTSAPQDQNGATENAMKQDAKQCYANALAWYHTGNTTYAENAIKILNTWSSTFTGYSTTQGQSQLDCSWIGSIFAPAAEIMRGYTGWTATQQADAVVMFKTKFVPTLNKQPIWSNGNIDLTLAEALMSIAVFCEDATIFNAAVTKLNTRIPLYFYMTSDGTPNNLPNLADWSNPNPVTNWVDGLTQETCRDNNHHAQFAMAAALHATEVAFHQGVDIYTPNSTRFVAVLELMAKQVQTGNMQGTCNGTTTTDLYDTWEVGYNHYANRKGIALPNTYGLLTTGKNVRVNGASDWNIFYETLTHDLDGMAQGVPSCSTPVPTVLVNSVEYSVGDVASQLSATGDSLKWYTTYVGGTASSMAPTPITNIAGTTIYYVSQTKKGCESPRVGISVNVLNLFAIPETNSAMTIDGKANENVWSENKFLQNLDNAIVGTITNAADLSANMKALWDADNLYLFGNITDNIQINDNCPALYNDDALELYLDLGNDKAGAYGTNDFLFTFRWSNPSVTNGNIVAGPNNPTASIAGINFAFSGGGVNGTGYTFEASIPWNILNGNPAVGQMLGFDLHVNDNDAGACTRKSKLTWNASTDQAWTNPTYFGTAKLGALQTATGMETISAQESQISYFPNPFTEHLKLNAKGNYQLFDLSGELVENGFCDGNCQIGIALANGVYLMEIQDANLKKRFKVAKQ